MATIEVIYEHGILRPVAPLSVPEGTHLEATLTVIPESTVPPATEAEAARLAFLAELDAIAALPLEGPPQQRTAEDHDSILYPTQGPIP
jgi:predicted DNA-binding antitoxin AbrB/MazE fold protein